MQALLDMPVSASLPDVLQAHGHEDIHAHDLDLDRAADRELLAVARRDNHIIIAAVLDFPAFFSLAH